MFPHGCHTHTLTNPLKTHTHIQMNSLPGKNGSAQKTGMYICASTTHPSSPALATLHRAARNVVIPVGTRTGPTVMHSGRAEASGNGPAAGLDSVCATRCNALQRGAPLHRVLPTYLPSVYSGNLDPILFRPPPPPTWTKHAFMLIQVQRYTRNASPS